MDNNIILYDWLSFTIKDFKEIDAIDLLGMSTLPWDTKKGSYGYHKKLFFNSISIHFDGLENQGICVEMSGEGCRAFETYSSHKDYNRIFNFILSNPDICNLTRLDVAFDDKSGILNIDNICSDVLSQNFVSKARYWESIVTSNGNSVLIGSPKSEFLIRIYDKAKERGYTNGEHWVRLEMQMRRERAVEYIKLPYEAGESFCGTLFNYLRFVEPNEEDSNKSRWALRDYWANLIEDSSRLSIYKKVGVEYNMTNIENYVVNQCGNAFSAMVDYYGLDETVKKINERKTRPNPKYKLAVDNARKEFLKNES